VTTYQISYAAPVPPREQNQYWQYFEKLLGVTWEPDIVPAGENYAQKLAARTAGDNLPDLTYLNLGQVPDHTRVILQGAYTDLEPYVTGDALKEYANLAAFDPRIWERARIRGKLYGVPLPRFNISGSINLRRDWAEKAGTPEPRNAEELSQLVTAFTRGDPDANGRADTYGLGAHAADLFSNRSLGTMFRVPNGWRLQDGRLTNALETEEFKQTVAFQRRLWEAGLYAPDSVTMSPQQGKDGFIASKYGMFQDAIQALYGANGLRAKMKDANPGAKSVTFILPGHDGGQGVAYNESGYFGFTAIPARVGRDRERVRELLRILNYLAAPFGSEENGALAGLEGVHYTVQPDGTRLGTDQGRAEQGALRSLMNATPVFYYPDAPGDAEELQGAVRELTRVGIDNPVEGLYSATNATRGGELNQLRQDRLVAVITGREPFGAFDRYVSDWRGRGGDQIRQEYEDALKER
jgi:putative aldouronate transport system substrate-binding protein